VSYIIEALQQAGFEKEQIVVVVGFCKEKVKEYFGDVVTYAEQEEQLGTAHAACIGIDKLSENIGTVLVVGGDDSAFYSNDTLLHFIHDHLKHKNMVSLLTVEPEHFESMGRVIRDEKNNLVAVIEKEELNGEQKNIREVSTGTYCLDRKWFEEIFLHMKSIKGLEELGLSKIIEMAIGQGKKVEAMKLKNNNEWFGINTLDELNAANKKKSNK